MDQDQNQNNNQDNNQDQSDSSSNRDHASTPSAVDQENRDPLYQQDDSATGTGTGTSDEEADQDPEPQGVVTRSMAARRLRADPGRLDPITPKPVHQTPPAAPTTTPLPPVSYTHLTLPTTSRV